MFCPVYENPDDDLIIAIIEFAEDDLNDDGEDEFVITHDVEATNYIGTFSEHWDEYYLEDSIKCNTLKEAQRMLLGWAIK